MDENLLKLFCIENDFPKYVAKYCNLMYLFKYFVLHMTIIPGNDTLLYHRTKQISLKCFCCIILGNTFLTPEYLFATCYLRVLKK